LELSVLHIYIDHNYKGILRFSVTREFHNLCIEMKMYQITLQSEETLIVFKKNLESDPNNPNLIDIIPTKQVLKEKYHLSDAETLVDYIRSISDSNNSSYKLELSQSLTCTLERNQIRRVFNFFNSFVTNFTILDSVFKIYINMLEITDPNKQINPILSSTPTTSSPTLSSTNPIKLNNPSLNFPEPVSKLEAKVPDLAAKKEESEIERILNTYCLNNIFKSLTIHHIFNHLRYLSNNVTISKSIDETNKNNIVTIPVLFDPFYYSLNFDNVVSVLNSTFSKIDAQIISFNQKKIIETIQSIINKNLTLEEQDLNDKLLIVLLLFIFYSYSYRSIISMHPDFDFVNYFTPEIQQAGINFFINKFELVDNFEIKVLEEIDNDNIDDSLIESISAKYKHLIPVSEIDFLNIVVSEYKKPKEFKIKDFNISLTKILDVETMMSASTIINNITRDQIQTINTNNYSTRFGNFSLLNFEEKIITKTYDYFKKYLQDPTILTSLLSMKELPISKQILSLFDFFSRNLPKLFKDDKDNNTLNYYKILIDNLPAPKSIGHHTYLFLIYNLIIPYYVDNFKETKFVDCLI
jgi:hypothetical protein